MWKQNKISKLKVGYTSSAILVFQSWPKDICVHVEDRRLTEIEAMQLEKDFTAKHAWDVLFGHGDGERSILYRLHRTPA